MAKSRTENKVWMNHPDGGALTRRRYEKWERLGWMSAGKPTNVWAIPMVVSNAVAPEVLVRQWLLDFAQAVRSRDYETGRSLFAPDVVGFGTVASRYENLQDLETQQWRQVWGRTAGFEFEPYPPGVYACGELASAACLWRSYGYREDGRKFLRKGRCTFVFQIRAGKCLAVHSHFSMIPGA